MPSRAFVSKELAKLLGVLSHPHRIRIIEELRDGEKDVNSLQAVLKVSHSGVSQHLGLLRSHRLVEERREGRHVFYHLSHPNLARWLTEGLEFLGASVDQAKELREAVEVTRNLWSAEVKSGVETS
jgi:DNA-binding transcriptional ArsR family regulator